MKTKCLGQISDEMREWFSVHIADFRESEKSRREKFRSSRYSKMFLLFSFLCFSGQVN